jgi:NAD(P)-dependent dehydrogenase (short-subunit alcohol dehydrogenase family)
MEAEMSRAVVTGGASGIGAVAVVDGGYSVH